jgi:glycosyltransferase involved in cell wall biosynthesis
LDTKKNFKILVLTYGSSNHASSRIRAIQYFEIFNKNLDAQITWIPRIPDLPRNNVANKVKFALIKRLLSIKRVGAIVFSKYDLIFIQRTFIHPKLLALLTKRKTPVLYDFDDAIYLKEFGKGNPEKKTLKMLEASAATVVSSPILQNFCKKNGFSNVHLIHTPIDTERFYKNDSNNKFTIGWIGSSYTSHYLKSIEIALQEISKRFPVKVLVVGAGKNFNIEDIDIENENWNFNTEPELIAKMDVGLMPLNADAFSTGKGGYKLFQYMAAGIPVIASPVGINSEIVIPGQNGFLASNIQEWTEYLSFLISNPKECKRMGNNGRDDANTKYSRKYCAEKLLNVIKSITN